MRIADPFRNSKTQIQVRSRKSREYVVGENHLPFTGLSVFVHFKRGPGLAPHRYRENGKRRDAPPGSSLRASNAQFHYRHPTSRLLRIVYFARYADAGARVTQLYTQPRSVLTRRENFGKRISLLPRSLFPSLFKRRPGFSLLVVFASRCWNCFERRGKQIDRFASKLNRVMSGKWCLSCYGHAWFLLPFLLGVNWYEFLKFYA